MPVRVVLNAVYAMLTTGMDTKEREDFDNRLYGWDALNERANRALRDMTESGGES